MTSPKWKSKVLKTSTEANKLARTLLDSGCSNVKITRCLGGRLVTWQEGS
jgi:hypothetical protein